MHVVRLARNVCGVCTSLLLLAACGGGGGGGSPPASNNPGGPGTPGGPNPPAGQQPTFGISGTTLTFASPHPNLTPDAQRIGVTFSGSVNGQLYILASVSDRTVVGTSVDYSSTAGQAPTVDAFAIPASPGNLLPGTYTSAITLTACVDDSTCQTGQLPGSPQTVNVTYTLKADKQSDVVGPRVVTAGDSASVILHGRGLAKATTVLFGNTAGLGVRASSINPDGEIYVSYPVLAPGTYPITINGGDIPFTASLVVVAPPNYPATKLAYPSTPQEIGGIIYDAQRQALFVAARYADSQTNKLFKFQFSGGAWQAPTSVSIPNLQDVGLSPDGTTLILATDTAIAELDARTLTSGGVYPSSDELVRAGTAYIQNLAVAADGYAVVTTGGANPSNVLLYSTATHAFFTVNSVGGNLLTSVDPRLYFGNPGVSADGALVVLTQDPRSAAALPDQYPRRFFYLYSAAESQRGILFGSLRSPFTDKDRSQSPRSAKPAVNHIPNTVNNTRIVVNGPSTTVVDAGYEARGLLPDTTRASVFKPDASLVYTFDAPAGTESGALRTYSVAVKLNPDQLYPEVGTAVPMTPGSGTGAIAMAITPDGGTVFVVGTSGVFVQPASP